MVAAVIAVFDLLRRDLLAAAQTGRLLHKGYLFQTLRTDQLPSGRDDIMADWAAAWVEKR